MAYLTVNGARMFVERAGSGPPLVLVHGEGEGCGIWAPVAGPLAREFSTLRYDLRGHGRSEHSAAGMPPSLETHLTDLAALLDRAGIESAHFAGHDVGGMIAQRLAFRAPARVRSLVLECAEPAPLPESSAVLSPADAIDSGGDGVSAGAVVRHDPARSQPATPDTHRRLESIECPTLVLVGSLDAARYQHGAELLHGWIPNSRLVRVEGAAHAPHVERPRTFLRHALAFLREF